MNDEECKKADKAVEAAAGQAQEARERLEAAKAGGKSHVDALGVTKSACGSSFRAMREGRTWAPAAALTRLAHHMMRSTPRRCQRRMS